MRLLGALKGVNRRCEVQPYQKICNGQGTITKKQTACAAFVTLCLCSTLNAESTQIRQWPNINIKLSITIVM